MFLTLNNFFLMIEVLLSLSLANLNLFICVHRPINQIYRLILMVCWMTEIVRNTTIQEVRSSRGWVLSLPSLLESSSDFSASPLLSNFDVLLYLSKGRQPNEIRNYKQMEGYQMQRDDYVLDLGLSVHCRQPFRTVFLPKSSPEPTLRILCLVNPFIFQLYRI